MEFTPAGLVVVLAALVIGLAIGAALGWFARSRVAAAAALGQSSGQESAQAALEPVGRALVALNRAVDSANRQEAESRAALCEQMRQVLDTSTRSSASLERETRRLIGALSRSDVRGRWGEMQLRRLLETSGLIQGVHYEEQPVIRSDEGTLRPDVVVHLGGGQSVVIDAKVSLAAFLRAEAADPGIDQESALAAHSREVAAHVSRLAGKEYWRQFDEAPDFVVLFLPAEALLAEALARDPGLLEASFARNVILATPTTLQAMLRTISHICRQEATAENARQIQALGRELHDRLGTLVGHFDKLGAALGSAVGSYNRAMGSLDSRVLVTARRFSELAGESAGLESPRSVEATPRMTRPRNGGEVDSLTLAGLSGVLPLEGASISLREPAPGRNQ